MADSREGLIHSRCTTKLHGVEAYVYLKAVLTRLPEHRVDRIDGLLPFNFQP